MTFEELDFRTAYLGLGIQAVVFFPNGYGASVIRHQHSYGGRVGLYELAVVEGCQDKWSICYSTPVTDDVLGYLTPEKISEILTAIEALPPS